MSLFKSVLLILMAGPLGAYAQLEEIHKHRVSLEIGGWGLLYSVNYHHLLNDHWQVRGGAGFVRVTERETNKRLSFTSLPLDVRRSFYFTDGKQQLDVGIGLQNIIGIGDIVSYKRKTDIFINPGLLLAYQLNLDNNLSLSASFTPFYGTQSLTSEGGYFSLYDPIVISGTTIHLWGGLGIGYGF